jgi:hypothetical protein
LFSGFDGFSAFDSAQASKATVVSGVAANAYGFAIVTPIVFE